MKPKNDQKIEIDKVEGKHFSHQTNISPYLETYHISNVANNDTQPVISNEDENDFENVEVDLGKSLPKVQAQAKI